MEIQRGNPAKAVELLRAAEPYEAAHPAPTYCRGLAYLRLRAGKEAAAEFQKLINRRGILMLSPLYSLAHLGLARGAALAGDAAASRKAYQDFFALWKGADPDISILKEARAEYDALKP